MEQPPWPSWLTTDNAATLLGGSALTWILINAKNIYEAISSLWKLASGTYQAVTKTVQLYQDIEDLVEAKDEVVSNITQLQLKIQEVDQLRELVLILFEALDIDVDNPYATPTDVSELTEDEQELIKLLRERKENDRGAH